MGMQRNTLILDPLLLVRTALSLYAIALLSL